MSNEIIDASVIGEKAVNESEISPSTYFDYVKGLKNKINEEESLYYIR